MRVENKLRTTPLLENNLLKGIIIPCFISAKFKRYAPKTTNKMPINFIKVGTSWIVIAAISRVRTGAKDQMGAISDICDLPIAKIEQTNATVSKIAEILIYK